MDALHRSWFGLYDGFGSAYYLQRLETTTILIAGLAAALVLIEVGMAVRRTVQKERAPPVVKQTAEHSRPDGQLDFIQLSPAP